MNDSIRCITVAALFISFLVSTAEIAAAGMVHPSAWPCAPSSSSVCPYSYPAPANIDGYPACTCGFETGDNGEVWTKDGIHLSASNTGGLTGTGVSYECVEFAIRYFLFKWQILLPTNIDAYGMCTGTYRQQDAGKYKVYFPKDHYTPVHGDAMIYGLDQIPITGHVAIVDNVNGHDPRQVDLVEENWSPSGKRTDFISKAECFIHATANNGNNAGCSPAGGDGSGGSPACPGPVAHGSLDGITAYYNIQAKNHDLASCASGKEIALFSDKTGNSFASIPQGGMQTTQSGYQCTEYAYRYFFGRFGIKLQEGIMYPSQWCNMTSNANDPNGITVYQKTDNYTPVEGDLMVFPANTCGTSAQAGYTGGDIGHIAVVANPEDGTNFSVIEQNWGGNGQVPTEPRTTQSGGVKLDHSCASCWIHANKNNGTPSSNNAGSSCQINFAPEAYALAKFNTGIAAALNAKGSMEIFTRDLFGILYHSQLMPAIPPDTSAMLFPLTQPNIFDFPWWTMWDSFPVREAIGDPIAITDSLGNIEVFYVAADGIWHMWQLDPPFKIFIPPFNISVPIGATWSAPTHIYTTLKPPVSNISAILVQNSIHLFWRDGNDNNIWTMQQNKPCDSNCDNTFWSKPFSLGFGKNATANISPVLAGNTLHIFYPGTRVMPGASSISNIMYIWHSYDKGGTWSVPVNLGDEASSNIATMANPDGRIEIFYRGSTEELRHMWQLMPGPTAPWNLPIPSDAAKDPRMALQYDPSLGEILTSDPAVITSKDGTPEVFYRGSEGDVWTFFRTGMGVVNNGVWSNHLDISNYQTASPISVSKDSTSRIRVFFLSPPGGFAGAIIQEIKKDDTLLNGFKKNSQDMYIIVNGLLGNLLENTRQFLDLLTTTSSYIDMGLNIFETIPNSYKSQVPWGILIPVFGTIDRDPSLHVSASSSTSTSAATTPGSSQGIVDTAGEDMVKGNEGYRNYCYMPGPTFGYGQDTQASGVTECMVNSSMVSICGTFGYTNNTDPTLVSQAQQCADWLLSQETSSLGNALSADLKSLGISAQLSQAQFDALVDLGYNAGSGGLQNFLRLMKSDWTQNPPDYTAIGQAFMTYEATGNGFNLTSRRRTECEMFLTGNPNGTNSACN